MSGTGGVKDTCLVRSIPARSIGPTTSGITARETGETMRSDARCNRLRILEAAAEVLALPGDTSLKSIARRAGVGQGTLYRHFPTRGSLVIQVYGDEVEALVTVVPALMSSSRPPLALRAWLGRLLTFGRRTPEFADAMRAATATPTESGRRAHQPLFDALSVLVEANRTAGTIEPGTTADDVFLLVGPLWRVDTDEVADARFVRVLDVVMRGLCSAAGSPQGPPGDGCRALPGPRRPVARTATLNAVVAAAAFAGCREWTGVTCWTGEV
jgi:AcrR family transcriptional regulator